MELLAERRVASTDEDGISRRRIDAQGKTECFRKGLEKVRPCARRKEVFKVLSADRVQHGASDVLPNRR